MSSTKKPKALHAIDVGHHDGHTCLRVWTDPDTEWHYPLAPTQAAAIIKRLAGALHLYVTRTTPQEPAA